MAKKKNKFDFESDELKVKYLNEIIGFFQDNRNEEIGFIAAEEVLDFFLDTFGEEIYKKGIKDCQKLLREKFEDLDIELDMLTPKSKGANGNNHFS